MSRTIEENVVKMRFDNTNFNKNVESSEKQLSGFKKALVTLPSAIGLGLANTLRNVNLSDAIGVGAALAGVKLLKSGISGLAGTVQSVAAIGINSVNSVMQSAMNQIKEGGMQRALNIEAAKFQLEGLNLDVETFMEAANYAVADTAYSLDAAAKAAAQFGASGITELEELKKALRGVSGVASMTNSSYEEISNIFTTVAGNGRLMGDQLRQFSTKGLNVAAELGKALNKTEAEVRDMVSKGQIDFKTFALAMDTAFGEHAKDANKTFTGAMANVRAALSKIGAEFASPYIQNMITFYNELRLAINSLKQELIDHEVFATFAENIEKVIKELSTFIKNIRYALEESKFMEEIANLANFIFDKMSLFIDSFITNYSTNLKNFFDDIAAIPRTLKSLFQMLVDIFDRVYGIRQAGADFIQFVLWIGDLISKFGQKFQDNYDDISATIESWVVAFKEVAEVVAEILGINKGNIEKIFDSVTDGIFSIIKGLQITDETSDKVKRTVKGFASVLDVIKLVASRIWGIIKQIAVYIPGLGDGILTISSSIGDWLTNARDYLKENQLIEKTFDRISKVVEFITKALASVGTSFLDVFFGDESKEGNFIDKVKDFITRVKTSLSDLFSNFDWGDIDFSPITDFFNALLGLDVATEENVEVAEEKKSFIVRIFEFFGTIFDTIKSFFSSHSTSSGGKVNLSTNKEGGFAGLISTVGDVISQVLESIKDFVNGLQFSSAELGVITVVLLAIIDAVKEILLKFFDFAAVVVKYSMIYVTSSGTLGAVTDFLNMFNFTFGGIGDFFKHLGELDIQEFINTAIHGKERMSELFLSLAAFIAAIGVSLFFLSIVDPKKLAGAVAALYVIIQSIGAMLVALRILSGILPNFNAFMSRATQENKHAGDGLRLFSNSLFDMKNASTNTFKVFEANSGFFNDLGEMFEALAVLIAAIGLSLKVMAKHGGDNILGNAAIIAALLLEITVLIGAVQILAKLLSKGFDIIKYTDVLKNLFIAIGTVILAMGVSFAIINKSLKNPDDIWSTFAVIAIIFAELALTIALLGGIMDLKDTILGGIALIVASNAMLKEMLGIAAVLEAIGKIDQESLNKAFVTLALMDGLVILTAALLLGIGALMGKSKEAMLGGVVVAGVLAFFAAAAAGMALLVLACAEGTKAITGLVTLIIDLIKYMNEAGDVDTTKIILKITANIAQVWLLVSGMLHIWVAQLLAAIPAFVGELCAAILLSIPKINDTILKSIVEIIDFANAHWDMVEQALYGLIFVNFLPDFLNWMDELWDQIVAWLKERIPVVIPDIIDLFLLLIETINYAMEGNWDKFDEGLQQLINNSLDLITKLLTGEETWETVTDGFKKLVEHLKTALDENKDGITDLLEDLGETAVGSIIQGIINGFKEFKFKDLFQAWKEDDMDSIEAELDESSAGVVNPHKNNLNKSSNSGGGFNISDWFNKGKSEGNGLGTSPEDAINGLINGAINDAIGDIDLGSELGDDWADGLGFDELGSFNSSAKKKQAQVNVTLYGDASKFFEAETKYQNKLIRSGIQ